MKKKNVASKLIGIVVAFTMLLGVFPVTTMASEVPDPINSVFSGEVEELAKKISYPYKMEGINYDPLEISTNYVRDNSTIVYSKKPGFENIVVGWSANIFLLDGNNNIIDFVGWLEGGELTEEGFTQKISNEGIFGKSYSSNLRNVIYQFKFDFDIDGESYWITESYRIYDDVPQNIKTVCPKLFDITINSKKMKFKSYVTQDDYFIEDSSKWEGGDYYIAIRDFAMAMNGTEKQFDVEYDAEKKAITLTSNKAYTPVGIELKADEDIPYIITNASGNITKVYLDSKELDLKAYVVKGNTYFKAQDLANLFGVTYTYDKGTRSAEMKIV